MWETTHTAKEEAGRHRAVESTRGEMVYLWAELKGFAEGLVEGGSERGV